MKGFRYISIFFFTGLITILVACRGQKGANNAPDGRQGKGGADSTALASPSPSPTQPSNSTTLGAPPLQNPNSTAAPPDSGKPAKASPLDAPVEYEAGDSIVFDVKNRRLFFYDSVKVNYENIALDAGYMEIDMETTRLHAEPRRDSSGNPHGRPYFAEGQDAFDAIEMDYNFKTKRGLIRDAVTQDGETYLHGDLAKKEANDVLYIKNARFTTCSDKEHPHFDIATGKAKVIPDDKVVTGPAVLRISEVPTPLALPFGFFPSQETRSSGIIFPEYGEQEGFGFFLRNFGYYFSLSDKLDLMVTGDIFTSLSFGARTQLRYKNRYKNQGEVSLKFSQFQSGDPQILEDFSLSRDFSFHWNHQQDPKSHPTFTFKADVNVQTQGFNRLNSGNVQGIVQNQFNSNINFSKSFRGSPFNLSGGLRHFQNTQTGAVTFTLPELVLNMSRINPFKRAQALGKARWYENIGLTYRLQTANQINTLDSLFSVDPLREIGNANAGMRHELNLNTNLTLLKYFFLTPQVRYDERWHLWALEREFDPSSQTVVDDTLRKFSTARQLDISANLSTNVFSTLRFKSSRLKGIRHTLSPAINFTYRPDLGDFRTGFYGPNGSVASYSPNQIGLYGAGSQGQAGIVSLGINNRLEAKMGPSARDSVMEDKRIPLIEQLRLNISYDLARDSLNLSPLTIGGRTTLFDLIGINLNMAFDPYQFQYINNAPRRINQFEWENGRLFRLTNMNLALNFTLRGQRKQDQSQLNEQEKAVLNDPMYDRYFVDFNVPYSLGLNYNIVYNRPFDRSTLTHTIGVRGELNLTPKWKVVADVNYDLANDQITTSSFEIYRDMHCWEMRFSVIPFGFRKSYNFTINVKSTLLQALKLNRQQGWFNN